MKRIFFATQLLGLLVLSASCAPTARSTAASPAAAPPKAALTKADLERRLDDLLPGMGAADLVAREKPQQDFERLCFEVGAPGREEQRAALCRVICQHLDPATRKPARVWLLRQLERIGRDESVPALARLLDDGDPEIRDLARRALVNNPVAGAAAALRSGVLRAKTPEWRIALINALGARRDAGAVPKLAELARERDNAVATAAIAALGDISTAEALAALDVIWKQPSVGRRATLAVALLRCAEALVAEGQKEPAGRVFEEVFAAAVPPQIRTGGLRGLVGVRGQQALPRLLEIVADESAEFALRALAASLTTEIPGAVVTASIAQLLPGAPAASQVMLLDALAERGDVGARPAVLALLKSENSDVRCAVLRALMHLGDKTTALFLAQAAASAEGTERDIARRSLARLRGDGVDEMLVTGLKDAGSGLRVELIRALSARRCGSAVPILFDEARQPDAAVRTAAFEALGELGMERDTAALIRLLVREDSETARTAAEDATAAICGRIEDVERRARPILAEWAEAAPGVRVSLVRVLGRVGGSAALKTIRAARGADNADLVDAAVRALAKWPTAEVLDDLLGITRQSEDKAHRVLALQGYVRLVGLPSEREPPATSELYQTAMSLAERPEEQKLVLGGLAKVADLDALRMAEQYLADEALRAEAEAAVVSIARLVGPLHRAEARASIQAVLAQATGASTRERGQQALEALRKSEGAVTAWLVSGPYLKKGRDWAAVFDGTFPPELPAGRDVKWRPLKITDASQPWVFDLTKIDSGSDRCVYVRLAVWSEEQQEARLEVGSDDAVKVWLNGRLVHEFRDIRSHTPFQDKVTVTLNTGWNSLLLKIVQASGGWSFSAAVKSADGQPLEGLKLQAEPPATPRR